MFTSPSQILCTFSGVNIYYYGVIMASAILIGTLISDYVGNKVFNLKKETMIDLAPYLIIFGIIGARIYYCILNSSFYLRFPTEILAIRHGGISIHGAMIGGFLGLILFANRHRLSLFKLCDVSVIGLSIAQSVGRWGNFFNSEAFGGPTNLPWKLYIAPQYRPIPYQDNNFFHPAFLYESICDFIIFLILLTLCRYHKNFKEGTLTLIYLILYSIIRIAIETIRLDSVYYILGIPVAILVSVSIIIIATVILINRK